MRRGNLLILLLAIVIGGIAAFMARNWMERHAVAKPAPPTSTIAVAVAPLAFGTVLTRDNVAEIPWAAPKIPEGAFATREELLNAGRRVVLSPMGRNELIMASKITGPGQRASLSALLEEGKRAVTVRVDDLRGVAGFVLPGDRVDVVLIRSETQPGAGTDRHADILIQHVKVLAIDQIANERQEKATIAKAVTLEVTTEQAQKILLASNVGRLSLVLRQAGEANLGPTRRISEGDLGLAEFRSAAPTPPAAASEPAPVIHPTRIDPSKVDPSKVVVFHGTKRAEYQFPGSQTRMTSPVPE